MKIHLRLLLLLLAWAAMFWPGTAQAQTPSLEFAPGAGNPTGNGPVNIAQVITFQNNTDNPTANTLAPTTPAVTATVSLSNQVYTGQSYTPGTAVSFGATFTATTATAAAPLFPLMNNVGLGGVPTATANSYFTATNGVAGGIDVTANAGVRVFVSTLPQPPTVPANQRYRYADLTVTFSQNVLNPVIQLVGLGGSFGSFGFSTELDLLTSGVTLSKLNGSPELTVNATGGASNLGQVINNVANPAATTGAGAASGSVLVTTPAAGVNTVSFRLFLRPSTAGGTINDGTQNGDSWTIGVSTLTAADVATSITPTPTGSVLAGAPLKFDVTYTNAGPGTAASYTQTLQLTAGLGAGNVTFTNLPAGVTAAYNSGTGAVTFTGSPTTLASQANQNLTVNILVVPSGLGSITASSTVGTTTSQGPDTGANSATSTVTVTPSADLVTTISGPATAVAGQTITYYANTTNSGTINATGTQTTITLPGKPATVITNGSYNPLTGVVTFSNGTLAPGAAVVNSVSFVATGASATGQAASTTTAPEGNLANNNGSAANANVTTTISPTGAAGTAAPCATAGKDGAGTLSTNPNAYYPSIAAQSLAVNATTIQVSSARGAATNIAPGDLLLVIQMQGADIDATNTDSYGDGVAGGAANGSSIVANFKAGTYEYVAVAAASATVTAAAGGTITLASGLKNSYVNAVATATTGQRTFQVIRIPQYSTLTLSANLVPAAWDGRTGGMIAIDVAGQLNMAGFTIDASGKGFRGGAGRGLGGDNPSTGTTGTDYRSSAAQNTHATKGEGLVGTPRYVNDNNALLDTRTSPLPLPAALTDGYPSGDNGRGAPGNAGGGGTDANPIANDQNTGGGGGANGGNGGRGGNAWNSAAAVGGEPGAAFPAASSSRLVLGGGGGAGTTNNSTGTPGAGFASSGAAGGGAVMLRVGTVTGTGAILANGANANDTVLNDGSGGGGAGGSILVTATNSQAGLANLTLLANGGKGGTNTGSGAPHGPGGGGGGGIILTNGPAAAASAANGAANGTTAGNIAFGAEAGLTGIANPAISNSIANSVAGAGCVADIATTITGPLNAAAASAVTLNVTFSNNGALPAANTTRVVTFPASTLTVAPTSAGGVVSGTAATGFTITYPALNPEAAGFSQAFTISYTAPATGSVTATATTTTTTAEGGLTANNTASVTTYVGLIADVTTALTGPASVNPGQPTGTYTATFTNEGPSPAINVGQKVTLPAGATNVFVNGVAYTPVGGVIDFGTVSTLNAGVTNSYAFSYTPAANATGSLALTSNVTTTSNQGGNQAPDASTLTATVTPVADVTATIVATTPSVAAGTLASAATPPKFTVTFNNTGSATAAGVVATVQLPTGLTNVTATNGGVYNSATGVVTYAGLTSIATSTPTTSVITFDAPLNGPVVATAAISTTTSELGQTANNLATASMTIAPAFDLTTTVTGPASAVPGNLVTLAVTTSNNGPSAAANAVQTLQLATGLTNVYVSNGGVYNPATTTQTIVSNGVSYSVPAGGVVFPTFANLPAGQTVVNSVSYSQPATAFAPSALVTPNTTAAGETNTANNTAFLNGAAASTTLTNATPGAGAANAYTRISSSVSSTTIGSPVTLTVVTGNNGPATATGVQQKVQILPGYTAANLQVNGAFGTLNGGTGLIEFGSPNLTYNPTTGIVTFATLTDGTNGSTSGTSVSNTITFPALAATGSNGQLLAMAAVSTTNTDPVPADNVASVAVTLVQRTDLTTSISGPTSATAGQTVQYTATFTNNGPMAATGVVETVQLPSGLATPTVTDGAGNAVTTTYNATTGLLTLPALATDASGTTQVFRISFAAPGTDLAVRSSVNSTSFDAVTTNNSATATTTVLGSADLTTTVSGPATAVVGNPVTYSVVTANNGLTAAPNAITTLQLAAGFTPATIQVNGQTGTPVGGLVTFADGSSYDSSTGLLTFGTVASLANGASTANYVTFLMPNPASGQVLGTSSVSSGVVDPVANNNASGITTSIIPANATSTTADLTAAVTASATPVLAGTAVTFTATYGNAAGSAAAANVRPSLQLQPGLAVAAITVATQSGTLSNGIITFPNGATYNQTTGVVTFPTIASQAAGAGGNVSYAVQVTTPNAGSLTAVAVTTSDTNEPNTTAAQANNVATTTVIITPLFDVTTSIAGPASAVAGTQQTYTVTTSNNGPSPMGNTATQTVTVPAGQTPTNITNGGVYNSGTNTITWTVTAGLASGAGVANSFTIVQPMAGVTLNATVSATNDSNTGNNTASITTTAGNQPPLAFAVVNTQQNPLGNTAATSLPILPLQASDPENALSGSTPYTVLTLPTAAQGILYYNTGTGDVAITANQSLTAAQAGALRFKPSSSFVGNATFTYLATDAAGNQSPAATYTIPVAQDQSTTYSTYNSSRPGGSNYTTGVVLAQVIDPNTAQYTAAGLIYNATSGALLSGAANGLPTNGTNAVLTSGTLPVGVSLDPATGRIYVSNAALLVNFGTPKTYTVNVTTTDLNGGTNVAPVTFTIGAYPLPVELSAFTATAKSLDAVLAWTTASEKNSAYFDVERSLNGSDFVQIVQVQAQGSSTRAIDYTSLDAGIGAKATAAYYRLKQVDLDGTSSYSPVRTVRFSKVVPVIALYPNPATSATQLDLTSLPTGSYQVSVLDATGRVVLYTTLQAGLTHALNLNTIASGTYTLLVRGQDGGSPVLNLTKRLVKE